MRKRVLLLAMGGTIAGVPAQAGPPALRTGFRWPGESFD